MSEIEARLARRLAIAFWKGERAERIEVALFDAAPKLRPPQAGFQWEEADPLTTFDLKRFNAVRGYQAQQGREISRCLKELRQLRKDALAECTDEPEDTPENEPGSPRHPPTTTRPSRPKRPCWRPRNPRETNPGTRRIGQRDCPIRSWPRAAGSTTSGAIGTRRRQRRQAGRPRARAGRRSGRLEPGLDRLSAGRWRQCRTRRCRPAWCPACRNPCRCWAARSGGSRGRRAPAAGRPR